MKTLLVGTLVILALGNIAKPYALEAVDNVNAEMANNKKENACVKLLIAEGVERIDIATGNGECWEEANGYYN